MKRSSVHGRLWKPAALPGQYASHHTEWTAESGNKSQVCTDFYAHTNKYTHASPWHKSLYLHATLPDMFLQAATGTHTVPVHLMHLAVLPTWAFHSMPCRHVSRHNGKKFAYENSKVIRQWKQIMHRDTIWYDNFIFPLLYTVFHKKTTPYLIAHNFGKCWLIFKKNFTLGLSRDRVMHWSIKVPSHLKSIHTLPCEM